MGFCSIRFCASHGLICAAVRAGTYGFPYSHVEAVLGDGSCIGAHFKTGVARTPSTQAAHHETYTRTCILPCTSKEQAAFESFLVSQIGAPYDVEAIIGIAASCALGPRDWHDPRAWICSELIAAALEASNLIGKLVCDVSSVTPRDVMLFLSASKSAIWQGVEHLV